ncbi:MAG TPA: TetR/AcrR family transcriptional regulator [Dongiaceae bacterium]|nr:TetR/AcrR family transcriptional regulator [Dongiaceae bacterium]
MEQSSQENQDPRAVRSREALRSALLQLLEEKALEQITVRDIVAKAGIGYTTFFRHHPTKESLLEDVAAEQISTLFQMSIPVMDAQDVRSGAIAMLSYVDEHRSIWSTLLTGGAAAFIREEFLRQARAVADVRGQSDNLLPPDLGTILIVGSALELIVWWLRQENPVSIERIADILDCAIVTPIIAAGSRKI